MSRIIYILILSTLLLGCDQNKSNNYEPEFVLVEDSEPSTGEANESTIDTVTDSISSDKNTVNTIDEPSDPTNLGKYFLLQIYSFINNEETDSLLSIILAGALSDSADFDPNQLKDVVQDVKILSIENGNVTWQNRPMQAAIVTVEIKTINRKEGSYGSHCILYAAISDTEFSMIRDYFYTYCEESKEKVLQWRNKHGFTTI